MKVRGVVIKLTPLFPHVLPPLVFFHCPQLFHPLIVATDSLVLCLMDVLILKQRTEKEQILVS